MPNTIQRRVNKQIKKIIEEGKGSSGRKSDPLLEKYIFQFYQYTPVEFLQASNMATLYTIAAESWKFVSVRDNTNENRKVRVFNPTTEKDGWSSPRTIIELNINDSPFILDSISAELIHRGYRIYEVVHPILRLKRDASGKITEIYDSDHPEQVLESTMHFQISHIIDEKEIAKLEQDLDNCLHFVNVTVSDWKPMMTKVETIIEYLNNDYVPFDREYVSEVQDFLKWDLEDNFIFLGYRKYSFGKDNKGKIKVSHDDAKDLGIFRVQYHDRPEHEAKPQGIAALPEASIEEAVGNNELIDITKSGKKSVVHRSVHMDYIGIKIFDEKGNVVGEHRLLGLFTSAVYYQSARSIPIIRRKIESILRRSGFTPDSHNGKALVTVLEGYPRDELLQISEDDLFVSGMGIVELMERPTTKFFIRKDRFNRFISCIIFVPRDRFNTSVRIKVQDVLEKQYNGHVTDYYTQVTESPLARVHMLIKIDPTNVTLPDFSDVEEELVRVTKSWASGLRESLIRSVGERDGEKLFLKYSQSFPDSFKDSYHFGGAFCDIVKMEEAIKKNELTLDLYQLEEDEDNSYQLKLYSSEGQVTLSEILPMIENMGFNAVDELTFFVEPKNCDTGIWIHHFRLKVNQNLMHYDLSQFKDEFETALFRIWHKEIEDDTLNKLIIRAGMGWRDIVLIRAYGRYIAQTDFPYSQEYTANSIAGNPLLSGLIVELFKARFRTDIKNTSRDKIVEDIQQAITKELIKVTNVAEDRIIRQFKDTIMATLRTNFFQLDQKNQHKPYLSFKLDSQKVPNLPLPRPHVEIFVYSREVEGVHLRGGKVARGGLRWSDRIEDYRTEVLGLVKAQMVKNTVIVPVGSKGGFVVKHPVKGSRDEVISQGQECYRTYLCGLLDITDNIVGGKIVPPSKVVRYDAHDPYLVVAADKGTATFSDIANGVAQSYGFWLDDAFASGGSVGYDHKKMGITARGAWVSVQRHFMEMGIDCQKEEFTCVGIGDMAGDVFGNGMLLSKATKLVGAFNHMHIFIDPSPNPEASWKERKRLFDLPRSSWMEYNKKLISKGGGIFERSAKEIKLSKEIRQLLDIEALSVSPDELIQHLLKARVDLLWNGGIGTYVKAEVESHEAVGDKANDSLRINGKELRCKIVGEGGNLGFTQLARIEYGLNGGRINTDAIDNSAGVDCSDHEVNIKIALNKAVENNKISKAQRNNMLARMTDNVAELVLRDNKLQTQAITIAQLQGHAVIEQVGRLMNAFEGRGFLDRKIEFLPDAETLALRQSSEIGLSRPEFSVLLAYAKMDISEDLINSNFPDEDYLESELISYFPEEMQKKMLDEIHSHQLRREIVTTSIANSIVNRGGTTFFHRMKEDTGLKGCDVARAYVVSRDAFRLRETWAEIESLGTKVDAYVQIQLFLETRHLIERASSWFLRHSSYPINVSQLVSDYSSGIAEISKGFDGMISTVVGNARDARLQKLLEGKVPTKLARHIANMDVLVAACDIIYVAKNSTLSLSDIGKIYFEVGTLLGFGWLRFSAEKLLSHSHWENIAVQTFSETFFDQQMRVTGEIIKLAEKENIAIDNAIEKWCEKNEKSLSRYTIFIEDLKREDKIDHSMLTVAIQRGEALFS